MPLRKQRVNIYVEPQQWEVLQAIHHETGARPSELVRRAIDEYVANRWSRADVQKMLKAAERKKTRKGGSFEVD